MNNNSLPKMGGGNIFLDKHQLLAFGYVRKHVCFYQRLVCIFNIVLASFFLIKDSTFHISNIKTKSYK